GIRRTDVVAVALRNGTQAAILSLALASYCRMAPLNPAYRAGEIEFALRDVSARLLITTGEFSEAIAAAAQCDVDVMRIRPAVPHGYDLAMESTQPTGTARADADPPGPDDVALLLHTSGTTARP